MTAHRTEQENQLLHDLVARYSPSGNERPAAEFLLDTFLRWGWKACIDQAGNVVGEVGSGTPTVCFLGHLDTVAGEIPVRREGNILYGRGSVDAKGPLAAAACAAARLPRELGKRIVIVGAAGEEAAGSPGASFFVQCLNPDFAIIGEPSRWDRITIAYKGNLHFTYTHRARRVHGAAEELSAATRAAFFFVRLHAHGDSESDTGSAFDALRANIRSFNTVAGEFEETVAMTVDMRLPPSVDPDELERIIRAEAGEAEIAVAEKLPAVVCDKNSRLARTVVAAIRQCGGRPRFVRKTGTSDMNLVAPVWQCPMLAYGPGDSALDHTPNEHIDLEEYQRAIAVLETAFRNL